MPALWTLAAFRSTAPEGTEIRPVDPTTIIPAIILWTLVTMNTAGQYAADGTPMARQVTDAEKAAIAGELGCTRSTVDGFFALAAKNHAAFAKVANLFETISKPSAATAAAMHINAVSPADDYSGPSCPSDPAPMLEMAKLYAAALPQV